MRRIIKPIITEKQSAITEKMHNCYGFRVSPHLNKITIKEMIEYTYKVTVENVNTMNYNGKQKRHYTKSGIINGRQLSFKKVIVMLKLGDTIDFFSNL